jgi:hypothetical protein
VVLQECWPLFLFCIALLLWIFPARTLPAGRWRRPAVVLVTAGLLVSLAASARGMLVVAGGDVRLQANGDLDTVRRDLLSVTETAFQPAHVSIWLAPAPAGEQRPDSGAI